MNCFDTSIRDATSFLSLGVTQASEVKKKKLGATEKKYWIYLKKL